MEDKLTKSCKQNLKIYSLYRAISLDFIFYYSIEFLFLTQVKGLKPAQVVLLNTFYAVYKVIFQIPISVVVDKLGTKKSTVLANIFGIIYLLLIMLGNDYKIFILANFFCSSCFSMKNVSDLSLLKFSIPKGRKANDIYAQKESLGFKRYFIIDAVTAIFAGSLFVINPYIPLIGSLTFLILATILSCTFSDVEKELSKDDKLVENSKYINELKKEMKFITKSPRLRSLNIYIGVIVGIFVLMDSYRASLLIDMGIPEKYITMIVSFVAICASIGSESHNKFDKFFRNKALTVIMIATLCSVFGLGFFGKINNIVLVIICLAIIGFMKGLNEVLIGKYLGHFASNNIMTQLLSITEINRNLFKAIICLIGSYVLDRTTTANAYFYIGIVLVVVAIILLKYMKTRLGLKPEQYGKNDIYNRKHLYDIEEK